MTSPPSTPRGTGLLLLGFGLFWGLVYCGANFITGLHGVRLEVHLPGELAIPFVPIAAVVYLSLNVLILAPWVVHRSWRALLPWWTVLMVQTGIGGLCFLLFPVQIAWPERHVTGGAAGIFQLTDLLNLEYNAFPSLHVAFACTAAVSLPSSLTGRWRALPALWAAGIALATLLLHEHHLADVAGGVLLAAGTVLWVLPVTRTDAFARTARAEWLCLVDCYRFSRRRLRYFWIAACVYGCSMLRWRRRRPVRVGFCLLQHVDDLLDGDRACPGDPLEVVDGLLEQWEAGEFDDSHLGALGSALWADTAALQAAGDDPRGEVPKLIRCMRYDRVRVADELRLTQEELLAHHRRTFHHSLNLLLMLSGAELRATDAPDLVEAFGWCSVMRDLEEDLRKGLVNVPAAVLDTAQVRRAPVLSYDALVTAPSVQTWIQAERRRAVRHLVAFQPVLGHLEARKGIRLLRMFHRSISRLASRPSLHSVGHGGVAGAVRGRRWLRGVAWLRGRGSRSRTVRR